LVLKAMQRDQHLRALGLLLVLPICGLFPGVVRNLMPKRERSLWETLVAVFY